MPIPISAPVMPPAAPPIAAPLKAAIIGPAAMKGPAPGMANAPIPANQPNAPPNMPPAPAPVAAPSGALVFFSCAKALDPHLSGKSTEISLLEKPAALRLSTIRQACSSLLAMQNTARLAIIVLFFWLLVCLNFQLIVYRGDAGHSLSNFGDGLLLGLSVDRPAQGHFTLLRNDFDVLGRRREIVFGHDAFANSSANFAVGFRPALVTRRQCVLGTVARINAGIVRFLHRTLIGGSRITCPVICIPPGRDQSIG